MNGASHDRSDPAQPPARSFRRSLGRWLLLWAAVTVADLVACALAFGFYLLAWEPHRVVLDRVAIERATRSGGTGPVRIVQVSDLDLCGDPGRVERKAARLIASTRPDFIVLTGDVIGNVPVPERSKRFQAGVAWLGGLPAPHGKFLVLGEEERVLKDELVKLLPPSVHLVEHDAVALTVGSVRVVVGGPAGFPPEMHPVDPGRPRLLVGEGWSKGARLYDPARAASWSNYEVTGRLSFDEPGGYLGIVVYAVPDGEGTRGYEFSRVEGDATFRLRPASGDGPRSGSSAPVHEGTWYRFRIRAETQLRRTRVAWRLWAEGEPEPAEWGGSIEDDSAERLTAGSVGIASGGWQAGRRKYLADLRVTPLRGGADLLEERFDDPGRFAADWPGLDLDLAKTDLVVFLAHNPNILEGRVYTERPDLLLAGHTHGGQIVLPLFGPALSVLKPGSLPWTGTHDMGGGLTLHINRGLGTAVYPIRFNCPPEVTLIEAQIVPR